MILTTPVAGYFTFSLEPKDFKLDWQSFLADFKAFVALSDRDYDHDSNQWKVTDSHYPAVRTLKQKYFEVPNHDLFEEQVG